MKKNASFLIVLLIAMLLIVLVIWICNKRMESIAPENPLNLTVAHQKTFLCSTFFHPKSFQL